jgi:membrane associated rhomboid family serine protease
LQVKANGWFLLESSNELGYIRHGRLSERSGPVSQPVLDVIRAMNEQLALCNSLVILVTVVVSYAGFRLPGVEEKYIFRPESILAGKEYYRLVTSAFLHAGWGHLMWNMVSLYLFGGTLERALGKTDFLLIYFGAIIGSNLLSLYVHRHHDYLAYGASGGVCGVIFAYILLFPGSGIMLYFAVPIPGWLYAIGFMVGSFVALKKAKDNIGHDAHLGGAIVGLLIAAALHPEAVAYNWKIFLLVLGLAIVLLIYLWLNPLFLSSPSFFNRPFKVRRPQSNLPRHKRENLQVDAILDKIAKSGTDSLTADERALLEEASGKLRRRAESKKPESGLAI